MRNELKEWLASDDNSEDKLREIAELIFDICVTSTAPIYRAARAAVYAAARAVVYADAAAAANARDAVQILVDELENDNEG